MVLKYSSNQCFIFFLLLFNIFGMQGNASNFKEMLLHKYTVSATTPSDIFEHLPLLKSLASECSSVVEVGLRSMVSTWGLLQGLSESPSEFRSYLGIDIAFPPIKNFQIARYLAIGNRIQFNFWKKNSIDVEIPETDLIFIDSLHTYAHLSCELERFSSKVNKYIALHDTSAPWGELDDSEYNGDYSEYPDSIDKSKRGLWIAVEDFLSHHPEWKLEGRHFNNHGFTILKRVD